ncbi:hypothetical protein A2419_00785 [Candidatus Adlerbacteria bacterium RIFOXYC1_FULL_48_26]|uniref:histidine kinase n=1 Tax=Candidatus Adlerbacteria bacterium RIFOXYC1_FULL_48_26 TaxID=1797247 RepID=A0A1F4Y510_9BACT|nr:MAG: hypothetical protein A2419_00785 [Candidatus Adlerbacteria bacterium RIFOXYC1_FULL_48_26]OGC93451.1 MAG: hypothetical protein A2389_00935 [Candidatus Adlerbacteria bacterium RIFOXYB1_FULL_48_10]OGC95339.1 MAG: hypothetical protein A2590_02435 [Candidatus Adlerbacteria bacterium RIFOXYD1_FULL_48_8]
MDVITLTKFILGCTLIGELCLLYFVLKEERSIKKLLFALFVVGIIGWTLAIFINLWAHNADVEKFVFGFAAVFLTAQVLFAQLFPDRRLRPSDYWSILVGAFFLVISFWNGAVFSSIELTPLGYTIVENGFLSEYYSLFALAFVAAPIAIFAWRRVQTHDPSFRAQLKYLILGFSIFLGVNILTNSLLPVFFHVFFFNAVGPVFSLVLAGFIFYIIYRYEFLDIHTLKDLLDKERIYARELEGRVRERTKDIEELRAREWQLMQDIAHAQQTALTILKTDVERLKQNQSETTEPILRSMEQGIDRASSLTYDLLRAAQFEAQAKQSYELVDLSALAKKVAEDVDIICGANNISLTHNIEPGLSIMGDIKQLEELFLILLSNAVRYRKQHTSGTIALTLMRDAKHIILSIADTGIGIAGEHLPHLFERFYRVRTTGNGNGLGLAIAKAIAETHGGTIAVQSTEGEGSEFRVSFSETPLRS